ncbi:MAG: hypothetical protein ACLFNQ_12315 [Spirochaetaceae bacterium]
MVVKRGVCRSRVLITRALFFVALFVTGVVASGQSFVEDRRDALARPRFMLFVFEVEPDTMTDRQSFILYSSLLTAAAASTDSVVIVESPDASIPSSRAAREALARAVDADSILHVIASGGFENLTVEFEAYDLLRARAAWSDVIRPGFRIDFRVLTVGLWEPMETALHENFERIVEQTALTVSALPGSVISGLPGGDVRIGESGRFETTVPSSSSVVLSAELPGYYREKQAIFVSIDPVDVAFDQVEQAQMGVDVRLSSLQFPGTRVWYYAIPGTLYLRAGFMTQYLGVFPIDNSERLFQTGSALSFLSFDSGVYVTSAERQFRSFVGAGGYLRIAHPSLSGVSLDRDAAPAALTLTLGGEYAMSRRLQFLIEYEPALIFAGNPQRFINASFARNRFPDGRVPGLLTLDSNVVDLRNLFLGLRLDF